MASRPKSPENVFSCSFYVPEVGVVENSVFGRGARLRELLGGLLGSAVAGQDSETIFVGSPLCPYGTTYRRCYAPTVCSTAGAMYIHEFHPQSAACSPEVGVVENSVFGRRARLRELLGGSVGSAFALPETPDPYSWEAHMSLQYHIPYHIP